MEKDKIGTNAGVIWRFLDENGDIRIDDLMKKTKLDVPDLYLALGWLARENKVIFFDLDNELAVCIVS